MGPFYKHGDSSGSSFYTARRSTPNNASRSSLAVNMVDPFVKLRPRNSTKRNDDDDWYIPYNKPAAPPTSYTGIGSSPHTISSKPNPLLSYFSSPLSPSSGTTGFTKTYHFPGPPTTFPQRPLATTVQSPSKYSLVSPSASDLRLPTDKSVPTGLRAPKLLFSPLARDARQASSQGSLDDDFGPHYVTEEQVNRNRTISAPARRHQENAKQWGTATMCDRLVFPRPSITPLVITPPASPDEKGSHGTSDDYAVMEQAKARAKERDDWADYVRRRGRSMSFGEQKAGRGAPILGNQRARSREHEWRQSAIQANQQRRSKTSSNAMWNRRGSLPGDSRPGLLPTASDETIGVSKSFAFMHPQHHKRRPSLPSSRPPADVPANPRINLGGDFYPSRYPSHRYGGMRGHAYSRSSPDLGHFADDPPPLPPMSNALRHRRPYHDPDVVVIGPGTSTYRAPDPTAYDGTPIYTAFHTEPEPSSRNRAGLSVTISSNPHSSFPSYPDVDKDLPKIPTTTSPTIDLAPFPDFRSEVDKAMSPKYTSTTTTNKPPDAPLPPLVPTRLKPRDSPARALLIKQHQMARTKRAFQSPRQPSFRESKTSTTRPDSLASRHAPSASTSAMPRRPTSMEEAVNRRRPTSLNDAAPPKAPSSPISPSLAYPISTEPKGSSAGSSSREPIVVNFLHVPLPPVPPMLRTESSATTKSKTTVYTDASEGWDRSIASGTVTPKAERPSYESGDTPSPDISTEDKDFTGLFFRTPHDLHEAENTSTPRKPFPRADSDNAGLGIGLTPPTSGEHRRPSDDSGRTSRSGTTGETNETRKTNESKGTDGTADTTEVTTPVMPGQTETVAQGLVTRPTSDEIPPIPVASSSRPNSGASEPAGVPKPNFMSRRPPSIPPPPVPHSIDTNSGGDRRVEQPLTTPTSFKSNNPFRTNIPFSPGTFGAPTPRGDTTADTSDYFPQTAPSTSTQNTPTRPPRPSPHLIFDPDETSDLSEITFPHLDLDKHLTPSPEPPSSPVYNTGRFSTVPSFVSDFPSPPAEQSDLPTQDASEGGSADSTIKATSGNSGNPSLGDSGAGMTEFGALPPTSPGSPSRQVDANVISSPSSPSRQDKRHAMAFGQVISGPPGAGKTTYAHGMHQFLTALGRPCHIINLDPAVKHPPYPCSINITDLIDLESVMNEYGLGPNGAMIYVAEYLEANIDWLIERLDQLLLPDPSSSSTQEGSGGENSPYVIFDTPGQVELWTNHDSFKHVIERLTKLEYRLVVVHLSDAHYITDASKYISVALLALRAMMQLELPHINVLSKIDLLSTYGELPFDLRYYAECRDLGYLLEKLESEPTSTSKMQSLNQAMVELIEEYGAVRFETLAVEDKSSMLKLLRILDKAIGYIPLPGTESNVDDISGDLLSSMPELEELGDVDDVQERWGPRKAQHDEEELERWTQEWARRKEKEDAARGHGGATVKPTESGGEDADDDDDEEGQYDNRALRRAMDMDTPSATIMR